MSKVTRREAVVFSAAIAASAGSMGARAAPSDALPAAPASSEPHRLGIQPDVGGLPVISLATVHAGIAYISGITADPEHPGDVEDQTRQALERIDRLLAAAGSHKSRLLSAQVWLTDMGLFEAHNAAWNEWIDARRPPVRACLQSPRLWRPGLLVEIMVTAAVV